MNTMSSVAYETQQVLNYLEREADIWAFAKHLGDVETAELQMLRLDELLDEYVELRLVGEDRGI